MHYRTVDDLNRITTLRLGDCARAADLIVGIPRSGLLAASMLALHVNRPLADLEGYLAGRQISSGSSRSKYVRQKASSEQLNVLVVDDSVFGGNEILRAKMLIKESGKSDNIKYAAAFVTKRGRDLVDFWGEVCGTPRVFEWNLYHSATLERSCVDIDGVLCFDPEQGVDDDGPRFEEFVVNAVPFNIPTAKVGHIVTCRLEKFRTATEFWLEKQGISYGQLHMMPYDSAEERRRAGKHAQFKAGVFLKTGSVLFIESSLVQACEISETIGTAVFCTEVNRFVTPSNASRILASTRRPRRILPAVVDKLHDLRIAVGLPPILSKFRRFKFWKSG